MVPRWSRLALAAVLACGAFGAEPALAGARGATSCPVEPTLAHEVSTCQVVTRDVASTAPAAAPLHAWSVLALAPAAVPAVEPAAQTAPSFVVPSRAHREPAWRLAPKTSPPRR